MADYPKSSPLTAFNDTLVSVGQGLATAKAALNPQPSGLINRERARENFADAMRQVELSATLALALSNIVMAEAIKGGSLDG